MPRKTLTHVPPEEFAAVRDKAGAKNIELARAMGVSPTRMTELTKTKGGTSRQMARVREALKGLRGKQGGTPSSRSSGRSRGRSSLSPA